MTPNLLRCARGMPGSMRTRPSRAIWASVRCPGLDARRARPHPARADRVCEQPASRQRGGRIRRAVRSVGRHHRVHDRDVAQPVGAGTACRRRHPSIVAAARSGGPAGARHPHAGRSDRAHSAPAPLVDNDCRTRCRWCIARARARGRADHGAQTICGTRRFRPHRRICMVTRSNGPVSSIRCSVSVSFPDRNVPGKGPTLLRSKRLGPTVSRC